MANRYPLIVDSSSQQIKEFPSGDTLVIDNLQVTGTTTTLETATLNVEDKNITINYSSGDSSSTADGSGLTFQDAVDASTDATILWDATNDEFDFSHSINITGGITTSSTITASTSAAITQVALTSSSNAVAWDAQAAANAYHLLTENTTFAAPSNAVEGAIISVEIAQGGTPYTVAWNTKFEFAASTAPTVTATANKTDIFSFRWNGADSADGTGTGVWQEIGRVQNVAQT